MSNGKGNRATEEDDPEDIGQDDDFDDDGEPVGSCMRCGANIYPDDWSETLCSYCSWALERSQRDDVI